MTASCDRSPAYRQLCSWENLLAAYAKAARGKRGRPAAAAFEYALADRLLDLKQDLECQRYRPGPYVHFHIHEPKRRKISAAPFRDRVVHHALCNVIEPRFERLLSPTAMPTASAKERIGRWTACRRSLSVIAMSCARTSSGISLRSTMPSCAKRWRE